MEDSRNWHTLTTEQTLAQLKSDKTSGLSQTEARKRNALHGLNQLPSPPKISAWRHFFQQFQNILIYVLLASALIVSLLGDWLDASVIFAVTLINAVIGFIQEAKAEVALDAIRNMLSLSATVLRDGQKIQIPAEALTYGDLVFLQSGDRVPADLRLIETKNCQIAEAAITGESLSVDKNDAAVSEDAMLGDRFCMAYSGTMVTQGQAQGIVTAIGSETEMGQIGHLLSQIKQQDTPLQQQMAHFSRWLTLVILALSFAIFSFGVWVQGFDFHAMFMAMVGLAVAAIPEGLPAVVTITLTTGVQRMAKRHAIVRKLSAVETLGEVSVICTDKTGTLTQNEMTVQSIATSEQVFKVSGVGYSSAGGFNLEGQSIAPSDHPELIELIRAGLLCCDATLQEGTLQVQGDPTEGALLVLGLKAGLDLKQENNHFQRIDEIPFESASCLMASLHHDQNGSSHVFLKGSPEAVMARCSWQRTGDAQSPLQLDAWQSRIREFASLGLRILAIAARIDPAKKSKLEETGADFTLLGLCGLIDPPRDEAIQAIKKCHEAGIRVKMITGDHALTAKAIAAQLNMKAQAVLTGADIESFSDADLSRAALEVDLFARTSPAHKLRLVQALQSKGQIVAMTGDGVNDAPALKRANVGIAMGMKGTEAAKEVASIVLADDNFATITHAIEEGRTIHDNLKKAIVYILPTSFGQAGAIVAAILLGQTLPITPLQILWVNMVTAITLSLAFALEPSEADVMQRKPRDPGSPLLNWFFIWRIFFVSTLLVAGLLGLFIWEESQGANLNLCRTVSVNGLVMGEIFYLFNSRHIQASALNLKGLFGNRHAILAILLMLIFQTLLTYMPFMQSLFGTQSIDANAWALILGFGLLLFLMIETEKYFMRMSLIDLKRFVFSALKISLTILFLMMISMSLL